MKESQGTRGRRITALVAVAVASLVAFSSLGGVGRAQTAVGLGQYGKKVTICHKGKRTIRISVRAWPAHKRHGDTEGVCANVARHGKKHHEGEHASEHGQAGKSHGKKAEHARESGTQKAEGSNGKSHGNGKGHS